MYRVMLADDEGIMLESLKTIIHKNFGNECEIACAKTGRAVVELAESFRPDIAFMDIQMPGINGIQAIREILKFNQTTKFVIITAYDKFDYAKEAINLGVVEYLTKPVNQRTIVSVLERIMGMIDDERKKRSDSLIIQEKLETVIPIVENGFVNSMLLQEDAAMDFAYYRMLLDIQEEYAYAIVLQFGVENEEGILTTPVGMSVKAQGCYAELRTICKEFFSCITGPILTNRMILVVPRNKLEIEYSERIQVIEEARNLVRKLGKFMEAKFRAGVGKTYRIEELKQSYREAYRALSENHSSVSHADDLAMRGEYIGDFPVETEKLIYQYIQKGDWENTKQKANEFFDWMIRNFYDDIANIQLKVLEFVIIAEKDGFMSGGIDSYGFSYRKEYLPDVLHCKDYEQLREWFLGKLEAVCTEISTNREERSESVVSRAKNYIDQNFSRDLTLDEVSQVVNVSPYYFSKLFKEEASENFIEYLTRTRINHAKTLLSDPSYSIKEICVMSGYSDPNYFSRIFKKWTDESPSEYRERKLSGRG